MRQLGREVGVSDWSVRQAIAHLSLKLFVRRKQHLITKKARERRLERGSKLFNYLKHNGSRVKIFSDKKFFTMDQYHNCRNNRWITIDPSDVPSINTMKHPAQVMVLGIITSDGCHMDSIFFGPHEMCNTAKYYSIMRYKVLPWLKTNYPDRNYVFQQDRAPAHTSDRIQKFCQKNLSNFWPKNIWPPSSPDLNPLDYFWWGMIKQKVNESPHPNLESLKAKIVSEWAAYPARDIIKACTSFRKRIEAVIAADGLHIEK